MTVLPNAPIDADTGLSVPTIAVATDGGVSVIKDDGTVVDITSTTHSNANQINFTKENQLSFYNAPHYSLAIQDIPTSDETGLGAIYTNSELRYSSYDVVGSPNLVGDAGAGSALCHTHMPNFEVVTGSASGITSIQRVPDAPLTGLSNYITPDYNTGWMPGDIKLATLSDTDTANVTGSELVPNGDFANGTTSWSAFNGQTTISESSGQLTIASSASDYGVATCALSSSLVEGKRYTFSFNLISMSGTTVYYTRIGTSASGSGNGPTTDFVPTGGITSTGRHSVTFTATATQALATHLVVGSRNDGTSQVFDDFSLSLAEEDRSVNGNGLQVLGTITKTAVATGAELVGYSGFSSSNYLQQPNNSDFEFGTGNWSMTGWISQNGTASTQHPIQLGLTSGSSSEISILRQTSSSSMLLGFRVRGDSGSYAANPAGGLMIDNVWTHFVLTKSGSQLHWYINGKLIHSVASSNVGNIGFSSSDILRIGHGASTVTADVMKLALLRISATAPTAEQIAKMYNDEKHLFQTNAKATLYGSYSAVTALAYDDDTELLHAGTSAGRSVFQGLNRVDNTTDAVDGAISASNGFIVED